MKKIVATGLGAALAAGLWAGFGSESAPAPSDPALEQVAHEVGLNVGGLALGQKIKFQTSTNEKVTLFNLTKTPVDAKAFENMINYYGNEAQSGNTRTVTIHPTADANKSESINAFGVSQLFPEHDFIIIPQGRMPGSVQAGAVTGYGISREVSVIQDAPAGDPQPTAFEEAVEGCQSMIDYVGSTGLNQGDDMTLDVGLEQETECNSFGFAMYQAEQGATYSAYQQIASQTRATVTKEAEDFDGRTFPIDIMTFSDTEYAQMGAALTGSAH